MAGPASADGEIRLSPGRQKLAALILALSNFIVVLDMTVANVSVPHIAGSLGVSLDQGSWVITSYAVAEALCARLVAQLDRRGLTALQRGLQAGLDHRAALQQAGLADPDQWLRAVLAQP